MNSFILRRRALVARDFVWIKQLIWIYFVLLIFEGALRKWILPYYANPLLLIRDPVVVAAYFLAWRSGLFPRNLFISLAAVIGLASLVAGFMAMPSVPAVTVYGFRTNFLQLPFIFLIARVFNSKDVERVGYWLLIIAIPMAALMALQFLAPPQSFINAGASDNAGQITSALGRIRPPGTFSFITGPVYFYATVAAFLLSNTFSKRYPAWLVASATVAMLCALAVSGSRSLLASIGVVFLLAWIVTAFLRPLVAFRWLGAVVVVGLVAYALSNFSLFQTGVTVFSTRISNASGSEGGAAGALARVASGYTGFLPALYEAPLFGKGLGMGTNVALALMPDKSQFIWFEDEWARNVLESGPLIGLSFIFYRIALVIWVGKAALRHTARRDPLPILLFGTFFLTLLNGIISQSTILGFAVFLTGLCLAAMKVPAKPGAGAPSEPAQTASPMPAEHPALSAV